MLMMNLLKMRTLHKQKIVNISILFSSFLCGTWYYHHKVVCRKYEIRKIMWYLVSQSPHLRTMSSPEDAFENPKKLHSQGILKFWLDKRVRKLAKPLVQNLNTQFFWKEPCRLKLLISEVKETAGSFSWPYCECFDLINDNWWTAKLIVLLHLCKDRPQWFAWKLHSSLPHHRHCNLIFFRDSPVSKNA